MKIKECLGKWVTIRPEPQASGHIGELEPYHELIVEETMLDDSYYHDVLHLWYKIAEGEFAGYFVNAIYPPNGARYRVVDDLPEDDAEVFMLIGFDAEGKQVSSRRLYTAPKI